MKLKQTDKMISTITALEEQHSIYTRIIVTSFIFLSTYDSELIIIAIHVEWESLQ